jgi:replicative DNA helicase
MKISLIYARATCRCAGELVLEVIDYLQLIKSRQAAERCDLGISEISRILKSSD